MSIAWAVSEIKDEIRLILREHREGVAQEEIRQAARRIALLEIEQSDLERRIETVMDRIELERKVLEGLKSHAGRERWL